MAGGSSVAGGTTSGVVGPGVVSGVVVSGAGSTGEGTSASAAANGRSDDRAACCARYVLSSMPSSAAAWSTAGVTFRPASWPASSARSRTPSTSCSVVGPVDAGAPTTPTETPSPTRLPAPTSGVRWSAARVWRASAFHGSPATGAARNPAATTHVAVAVASSLPTRTPRPVSLGDLTTTNLPHRHCSGARILPHLGVVV